MAGNYRNYGQGAHLTREGGIVTPPVPAIGDLLNRQQTVLSPRKVDSQVQNNRVLQNDLNGVFQENDRLRKELS
jgi:hypothetical protein